VTGTEPIRTSATDPIRPAATGADAGPAEAAVEPPDRNELLRRLASSLGNVAALTALLVYFGWVRTDVQARRLGIDESILGMSTRDYALRSVRSVLLLLIAVPIAGLVWLAADHWLAHRLRQAGRSDPVVRWALRMLPTALVLLPLLDWLSGYRWPAVAYVGFPLSCAGGLLLLIYSIHLRQSLPGSRQLSANRDRLLRGFSAIVVGIGLFTAAANFATVEGLSLADGFDGRVRSLPGVVVYSGAHLHITAPGVREESLPADHSTYRFRYVGLRLLEHTNGNYFLVSDGWTRRYGVVTVLADHDPVRLEFIRGRP
jgi:hypothetical protein